MVLSGLQSFDAIYTIRKNILLSSTITFQMQYFRWHALRWKIAHHLHPSKQQITNLTPSWVATRVTPVDITTNNLNKSLSHQFTCSDPYNETAEISLFFCSTTVLKTILCFTCKWSKYKSYSNHNAFRHTYPAHILLLKSNKKCMSFMHTVNWMNFQPMKYSDATCYQAACFSFRYQKRFLALNFHVCYKNRRIVNICSACSAVTQNKTQPSLTKWHFFCLEYIFKKVNTLCRWMRWTCHYWC